jgi:hypothetical protein
MTNLGQVDTKLRVHPLIKDRFRLAGKSVFKNDTRQRNYAMCNVCGKTHTVVNFEAVPSARIGLFGRCKGDKDYTHHKFTFITQTQYDKMQAMEVEQRVTWLLFESGDR